METLHGGGIAQRIRSLSDNATSSVCIVSPYIGRWPAVAAVLGGSWWMGSPLGLRIITDVSTASNVNPGTLKMLLNRGAVRSLLGVHAKVYIFDDNAVVTSANLTETAFTRRQEIGVYLERAEASGVIKRFEQWWAHSGPDLEERNLIDWKDPENPFAAEKEGFNLPLLWPLPDRPSDLFFAEPEVAAHKKFRSFQRFIASYDELSKAYSRSQRLWQNAPLYLEVDSFLNYLFHEAPGRPSMAFQEKDEPRSLTPADQLDEISRYVANFKAWALPRTGERWREQYSREIQSRLAKDRIDSLTLGEAKDVVDCLNTMNARRLNKFKFLQPQNNGIEAIRSGWRDLLFGGDPVEKRMQKCDASLYSFGPSSVQELLGWFYPTKFPIRNGNSDAGLRFLGFKTK